MSFLYVPPPSPDRALTPAQKQVLLAMLAEAEVEAGAVVEATGMRPNSVALALRGLERRGLVARQEGEPAMWTVTFAGRVLADRLDAVAAADDG